MTWQPPRPEAPPDIASTVAFDRRPFPRWLIGVLCLLVVAAVIGIYVVRGQEYDARAGRIVFLDESTVAVPLDVDNRRDSDLELVVRPGELPGFSEAGVIDEGADLPIPGVDGTNASGPRTATIPLRSSTRLLVAWRVTDCVRAANGETTTIYHGPGTIASAHLRTPTARAMRPPVCSQIPERGRPIVDDVATDGFGPDVSVTVSVRNTGGRELSFVNAVSAGSTGYTGKDRRRDPRSRSIDSGAEPDGTIAVGSGAKIVLSFEKRECSIPRRGPADVLLRFRTEPTKAVQQLRVRLASTWTSILGVCER